MPNSTLIDLCKIIVTNTGTGTLQLGASVPSYRGTDALVDGNLYSYSIQQGANYEFGQGLYDSAGPTLTRGVIGSSNGNAALSLLPNAVVSFTALAQDFQVPGPPGAPGDPGDPGAPGGPGPPGAGINMPVIDRTASYSVAASDANTYQKVTSATSVIVTVPDDATVTWPDDAVIAIEQAGAGVVTVAAGAGVTINALNGGVATVGQFAVVTLKKTGDNEWSLLGDTSAFTPPGINMPVVTYTAAHVAALIDSNCYLRFNSAIDINLTIPPHSSVAWGANVVMAIEQTGIGKVTIVPGAGVTIIGADNAFKTRIQGAVGMVKNTGTDTWTAIGDLSA